MTMPDDETTKLQVSGFPVDLQRQMKAAAALQGLQLREAFIEAARSWVVRNTPAQVPADT